LSIPTLHRSNPIDSDLPPSLARDSGKGPTFKGSASHTPPSPETKVRHAAACVDAVALDIDDLIEWVEATYDPFCGGGTCARPKHALTISGGVTTQCRRR